MSVDKSSVKSGETFTYTIRYSNSSTTDAANNVVITDVLPTGVEYVSSDITSDIERVETAGQTVRFIFKPVLNSGVTGMVKITAKFIQGTTANNTIVTNYASIAADLVDSINSNSVDVTAVIDPANWTITKTKLVPATCEPALDRSVQYRIDINANSTIGGQNLKDIVVVDTLPLNAEFVSCSDSGIYSEVAGTVTWSIPSMNVGSSKSLFITVSYPSSKFQIGNQVINTVNATAKMYDDTDAPSRTAQCVNTITSINFAVANPTKNGRQTDDRYSVGQTADFYIGNIRNSSNVPIDKISIVDNIPASITLTQITVGKFSNVIQVKVSYQKNSDPGVWQDWPGGTIASPQNEVLSVADLGLPDGEYITSVKWDFTNPAGVPVGIADTKTLRVSGIIGSVPVGTQITNTAQLTASLSGEPDIIRNASKTIKIIESIPWLQPTKSTVGGTTFNYNDRVTFRLRVQNHQFAAGNYENPILVDLLPPEFEDAQFNGVADVDWVNGTGAAITDVAYTVSTKEINGKTYNVLIWNCTGILEPGEYVDVLFSAKIKNLTPIGSVTNEMYIGTQNNSTVLENSVEAVSDTYDIDEDGSTADKFVKGQTKILVKFQGRLSAEKWIRGELEADTNGDLIPDEWKRHPAYSETLSGGVVDYKLVVTNDNSNGPISNIVIIDKLPTIGDTGVIDPNQRDSRWAPYLINKITGEDGAPLPDGVQIYYTTNPNPSLEELSDTINKHGRVEDLWSLTPPEDITTVKAVKFVFNGITLNPGQSVTLQWSMRAAVGAPLNQIAWNSFAYGATFKDSNVIDGPLIDVSFLPAEPVKVGHQIKEHPALTYRLGNYVWEDMNKNGLQDAGEPGINGILVKLYNDDNGNFIKYTRTGNDQFGSPGFYSFPNLPSGNYKLEFVYPSRYKVTTLNAGANDDLDSDIDGSNITDADDNGPKKSVKTARVSIINEDISNVDAGLYKVASLGDRVWNDSDADGNQDVEENGMDGITVELLNEAADTVLATTVTDAVGSYSFTNLDPGKYMVRFVNPSGKYKFTVVNAGGSSSATDSDAVEATGGSTAATGLITLISGENNMDIDAGMYLAQLGDLVWEDIDADGIKDAGENGIDGVVVRLYAADGITPVLDAYGNLVNSTVTAGGGYYKFTSLLQGDYVVEFVKPAGYTNYSNKGAGASNVDSDADTSTGKTSVIALTRGGRDMSIDCGFYKRSSIGDRVWEDLNANGIQDANEAGIAGVTVRLNDLGNNTVMSTTTNAEGLYSFIQIPVGNYYVQFDLPASFDKITLLNVGNTLTDNDADATGRTAIISVNSDTNDSTIDAGFYRKASLGGYVWKDANNNGIRELSESGISNAFIELCDAADSQLSTTTTDADGLYSFDSLEPGSYIIKLTAPNGMTQTYELDGSKDLSQSVVLNSGDNVININFGFNTASPVLIPNNPPVVGDYSFKTPVNTVVNNRVAGQDADGDALFYSKNSEPQNGTAAINGDGTWQYTPNTDFVGTDIFKVIVEDYKGGTAISTITITIGEPAYDLTGTITEVKSGKIIAAADIKFKDIAGNVIYSTISDSKGQYLIKKVKIGNYIMEVTKLGYSGISTATIVKPDKVENPLIIRDAILANIGISLVANPSTIVADGIQTSLLTTTVTDESNKPIAGVLVIFSAGAGSFPNGNTGITDSNGQAAVLFKSDKIEGVESRVVAITAKVNDEARKLYAQDQILMTFEPGSIQGIVVDNETGLPIQGAKVVVSKDFDGDGVIDFHSEMVTGTNGRYKIAIPKGGVDYNVDITKPFIIGGKTVYHTFSQVTNAGGISGDKSEVFDANKTAAGLILYSNTDGTVTQFDSYSNYSISVFEKNSLYNADGTVKKDNNVTPIFENISAQSGAFIVDNLEKNTIYTFAVMYEFESGKKIIVGTVNVNINSDGQLNICSALIDPYGDITDAVTGKLIEGAFVQLYYADTQRNRDAGIEPHTLVNLPILEDFPPADNRNPQYSDEYGKYAYMVFPTTDYYIKATAEGYEDYTSHTISVELEIVRHDFEMMPKDKAPVEDKDEEQKQDEEADNDKDDKAEEEQPDGDKKDESDNKVEPDKDENADNKEPNNQKDDDNTPAEEEKETEDSQVSDEDNSKPEEKAEEEQAAEKKQVLPKTGVLFDIRLLEALLVLLILTALVLNRYIKKQQG